VEEHLACTEEERVRLPPSPLRLRSVNGKHTPFVRPRCGFDSCRRLLCGRSSAGRESQACGVSGSTASSNLVGPGSTPGGPAVHDRRGPERLGYLVRACTFGAVAVRLRIPTAPHDRDITRCCGPERFRLSTPNRQARSVVSRPQQIFFTTSRLRAGVGRFSVERRADARRSARSSRARSSGSVAQSPRRSA
jgi:hypothetical protein